MKIKNLELKNYRNYDHLEIKFGSGLNIIIGNNAQGKTNILESIYTLALTKSYLSINDKNLIKFGEEFFKIKADVYTKESNKNLEILFNENLKRLKINDKEIKKYSEYISNLVVVLFSPDNIRMLKEGPIARRKYLNIELSQLNKEYLQLVNDYNNIIKQRNEYLKLISNNAYYNEQYLEIIDNKYVDLSIKIYDYRNNYINEINKEISKIFKSLTSKNNLFVKYISNIDYDEDKNIMKDKMLYKLKKNFEKEKLYKMTLIGPNRDDFHFYLNDKNISLYGSQGQLRLSILSLKFSEIKIFKKVLNENPIVLLDDIFSELDIQKRNKIIKYLNKDIQTIITTTDIKMIDSKILHNSNIYKIKNGEIINKRIRQEGKMKNE